MNDRFKFRAWDECNNKMHYDFQFIKSGDSENDWIIFQSDKQELSFDKEKNFCINIYPNPYFAQQLKIMQCTGLKDKNGKLIYEADIVDKRTRCKWIITWFKNRFILVPDFEYENKDKCANDRECGYKYFENNHSYADKDIEVIGNIYENKELLNA